MIEAAPKKQENTEGSGGGKGGLSLASFACLLITAAPQSFD